MSNNMINEKNYFIYKGVAYGIGTKVLFTEKLYQKYFFNKAKNKPHTFVAGWSNGEKRFQWQECQYWKDGEFSCPHVTNPDEEIAEIVEPVYVELIPWQKQAFNNMASGKVHADIFGGVLLYIITMVIGAIFNDRILIWVAATLIFICWLLNQYRN